MEHSSEITAVEQDQNQRWIEVANAALREVGETHLWQLGRYGPWLPGPAGTRDHYRSGLLATMAAPRHTAAGEATAEGHVVCWECWDALRSHECAEVTVAQAMRFEGCSR